MSATMTAGRELDALVAEKIFALGPIERDYPCGYMHDDCERSAPDTPEEAHPWHDERHPIYRIHHENGWAQPIVVPFYSTDIAAAWLVVERCGLSVVQSEDGWYALKPLDIVHDNVRGTDWPLLTLMGNEHQQLTPSSTAPLAICLAALAAVEAETPA